MSTAGPWPSAPTVPWVIFFVPGRAYGAQGTSPKGVGTGTRAAAQMEAAAWWVCTPAITSGRRR